MKYIFLSCALQITLALNATQTPGASHNHESLINLLKSIDNETLCSTEYNIQELNLNKTPAKELPMLIAIYMAADNDLRSFAIRNLKQILEIGSSPYAHVVVHIDIRDASNTKITRQYYIEKGKLIPLDSCINNGDQWMDSGDPETLISFMTTAIELFPAKSIVFIGWDHGSGYLDPVKHSRINPSTMFHFNPQQCKLELDRSIGYFALHEGDLMHRGVCWDQTTKNYLSMRKLDYALSTIRKNCMHGEKFALIAFDACLMSMLEIADLLIPHADIMVSSQEAILGTGFNYNKLLAPFKDQPLSPLQFAHHMVQTFRETYDRITQDFVLSAVNLHYVQALVYNVDEIAQCLKICLKYQKNKSVKNALQTARRLATHFNEPSYIDLHHLYKNIIASLKKLDLEPSIQTSGCLERLEKLLHEGCSLIHQSISAHTTGKKLASAHGLSIYFPERMHASYPVSTFAQTNTWASFLKDYIST